MEFAYKAKFKRVDVYKSEKYDFAKVVIVKDGRDIVFNINNNKYNAEIYSCVTNMDIPLGAIVKVNVDFVKDKEHNYYYCNLLSITILSE